MGFDNECILSIQSLPGEYFCPVCRTLIYPNEALQAQCTHLYCKPCLAYVVATTKACPYDGYLVTEADSKPLMESNKTLAETIGNVTVHCLFHKSGCQWHGTLSACITHGTTCAYGNSPVVCNRCGTQIVHRQVQEHAQLCHGLQSQTQQADGSQTQSAVATTQAVSQDPSLASAGSAAATATTLPSSITATAVTDSASAPGGAAGATTASMATVPASHSAASGSASQTLTAEQYYQQQQLQYSQYYQQQHPGYHPYMQQYQQYGQYQQVYQQYTQPPMSVQSQNMMQGSAQPASYVQPQVQSSQPQYMMQSQPQIQPQLQPSTGHPQLQQHPAQPQPQSQPHLQVPAGQSQPHLPTQLAPQVPQLQPQSQVPLQPSGPQVQPAAHTPAPTQVGNQQFAINSTQATAQVQPHVQAQPPQQQQHALNSQVQPYPPQVQQQSYPQPQAYAEQTHHMQPQNASYLQQQTSHGALLQPPVHASQAPVSQLPAPMRPPLPGQQPAMPQAIQHTTQHQQHIGYQAQWPTMHSNVPSQAPQQGLPPHSSVSSQSVQPYQQGMPSSQQQVHPQPGQHYTQLHVPGSTGHHVQNSAGRPANHLAPPQQFQHQQPTPLRTQSPAAGQPIGHGSSDLETHASKSGKSENASNAAVSETKNNGAESAIMRPTSSQSMGDENMNSKHNGFGGVSRGALQTALVSHGADGSIGRDGIADRAGNFHGPVVQGGKDHKVSDTSTYHEKGGSFKQISQQNAGALGSSYVQAGMGSQHPSGPDRMLPQHMMHPGHKHGFSENVRPPLQQPYGHLGMTPRPFGEGQMPISQPGGIRPSDGMVRPHMVGPLSERHDAMLPPFVLEHLGQPPVSGRAFHGEGFNTSGEHLRSNAAYPGRHDNIEDGLKQFPGPAHLDGQGLQRGPRPFERALGRPDGFHDSLPGRPPFPNQKSPFPLGLHEDFSRKPNATVGHPDFLSHGAEFDHFRNPGPFVQGMSGGPHGPHKDQLGSGNLPGNLQHPFEGPEFPPTRFHPGHMHLGDPNLAADYSQRGFPKESAHFGLGGPMRNVNVGWCRICMFNCGSAENLDLHVQTREHQQCAMDIVLKMKQDVAKRQKLNYGGPKSFHNKKVSGKGQVRGNRR